MLIGLYIYAIIKLYLILDIYQQAHYYIKPYFKHFIFNILVYDLFPFIIFDIALFFNNIIAQIIASIILIAIAIFHSCLKVKLKFSKRIIGTIILSIIYLFIFLNKYTYYLLIISEFLLIPLFILEGLLSKLLNRKYIKKALEKHKLYNGINIAITGSYGKTSTKNLFKEILNLNYKALATPKSFNTELGVASFINDNIIDVYDYLILEFGAAKRKDISKLSNLFKPNIAVVTEVGYMHMDGFKTIENVLSEKMQIVKDTDIVILNYQNELIRNYSVNNPIILSYGFNYGDYRALNINNGKFDFYYKDEFIHHFDTAFIAKHQILNLLAVLAYSHYIGIDFVKIAGLLKAIKLTEKRLEIREIGNRVILDDSFNSNFNGFKNALKVLKKYDKKRILITPGIVELGKYECEIYSVLARHIAYSCDLVILVGNREVNNLYRVLKLYDIKIFRAATFKKAYSMYSKISNNSALLIENDLPDLYRRGLLF